MTPRKRRGSSGLQTFRSAGQPRRNLSARCIISFRTHECLMTRRSPPDTWNIPCCTSAVLVSATFSSILRRLLPQTSERLNSFGSWRDRRLLIAESPLWRGSDMCNGPEQTTPSTDTPRTRRLPPLFNDTSALSSLLPLISFTFRCYHCADALGASVCLRGGWTPGYIWVLWWETL